jgi:hypothetical protein
MSVICVARKQNERDVKFKVSYLKNSMWLKDSGDARVMIHCVLNALPDSEPFSSLRIVVPGDVTELKCVSSLLLEGEHMIEYEDDATFKILKEDTHIQGNGGDYFVTDVTFDDVNIIDGDFTEISVNLASPVTPEKARGFRIEFVSHGYVKKFKNVQSYYVRLYDPVIPIILRSSNYTGTDIAEVEYSDLWVILPRNKISTSINPAPIKVADFKSLSPSSGYNEWKIEKGLDGRTAYRWRTGKCDTKSGFSAYGEFSSPPLPHLYTYFAIGLAIIGILITISFYFIF